MRVLTRLECILEDELTICDHPFFVCTLTLTFFNSTCILTIYPFGNMRLCSPTMEKWDYTGFTLSFCDSVIQWFRQHLVSTQYLENVLTESDQILT